MFDPLFLRLICRKNIFVFHRSIWAGSTKCIKYLCSQCIRCKVQRSYKIPILCSFNINNRYLFCSFFLQCMEYRRGLHTVGPIEWTPTHITHRHQNKWKPDKKKTQKKWKVLHLLWRTVFGYNIQHNNETKNVVLYCKYNHTVHGNIISDSAHILLAVRQRGEGKRTPQIEFCFVFSCFFFSFFRVGKI